MPAAGYSVVLQLRGAERGGVTTAAAANSAVAATSRDPHMLADSSVLARRWQPELVQCSLRLRTHRTRRVIVSFSGSISPHGKNAEPVNVRQFEQWQLKATTNSSETA